MASQPRQQIVANIAFSSTPIFGGVVSQIDDKQWDSTHWSLQTPMRALLDKLDEARDSVRRDDSSCDSLLKYFSLLYVFEQASRHHRRKIDGEAGTSACFLWQLSWSMIEQRHSVRFPWYCTHWELFFVGIKLGALLFEKDRLSEAALVYHAVIDKNAHLCQGHPDVNLNFFFSAYRHESEFCLLVERANEMLANKLAAPAAVLCLCNRLQRIVEDSLLLDAYYCEQLQSRLLQTLAPRLVQQDRLPPSDDMEQSVFDTDSDTGCDEPDERQNYAHQWMFHVLERQCNRHFLEMICDNFGDAIYKQCNREHRNDDQQAKEEDPYGRDV